MKNNKGKIIGFGIIGLAAVSAFAVGFSTWVINEITVPTEQTIDVTTTDVENRSVTIEVDNTTDTTLRFGPNATTGAVVSGTVDSEEDLVSTIVLTVTAPTNGTKAYDVSFTLGLSEAFKTAVDANYIMSPLTDATATKVFSIANNGVVTGEAGSTNGSNSNVGWSVSAPAGTTTDPTITTTVTVTLNFGWGSEFNYTNPTALTSWTGKSTTIKAALESLKDIGGNTLKVTAGVAA